MKRFFIPILVFSLLTFYTANVVSVYAVSPPNQDNTTSGSNGNTTSGGNGTSITLDNPFKATCGSGTCGLVDLFNAIINNILLPIGGVLAVCAFIWGGFLLVTSRGDTGQIKKAKNTLITAAIGTVLILGAWAIKDVIKGTITQLGGPSSSSI